MLTKRTSRRSGRHPVQPAHDAGFHLDASVDSWGEGTNAADVGSSLHHRMQPPIKQSISTRRVGGSRALLYAGRVLCFCFLDPS